jgi:hypothetical protein
MTDILTILGSTVVGEACKWGRCSRNPSIDTICIGGSKSPLVWRGVTASNWNENEAYCCCQVSPLIYVGLAAESA